jgi:hypothetical protein
MQSLPLCWASLYAGLPVSIPICEELLCRVLQNQWNYLIPYVTTYLVNI